MLNIESVLREKGMVQKDLAQILGVSVQAVNAAICGRSNPSEKLVKRYADALGVPKERLYDNILRGA